MLSDTKSIEGSADFRIQQLIGKILLSYNGCFLAVAGMLQTQRVDENNP